MQFAHLIFRSRRRTVPASLAQPLAASIWVSQKHTLGHLASGCLSLFPALIQESGCLLCRLSHLLAKKANLTKDHSRKGCRLAELPIHFWAKRPKSLLMVVRTAVNDSFKTSTFWFCLGGAGASCWMKGLKFSGLSSADSFPFTSSIISLSQYTPSYEKLLWLKKKRKYICNPERQTWRNISGKCGTKTS